LDNRGIRHETTIPYCPEQNERIERENRIVIEAARIMLQEDGLIKKYWAEAANTAIYVRNRCPSRATDGVISEELWGKKRVSLNHLRVFGCLPHAYVSKQKRQRLDPKGIPKIFVGYCDNSKGYRLHDIDHSGRLTRKRNITFFEHKFPGKTIERPEIEDATQVAFCGYSDSNETIDLKWLFASCCVY
jgi:hypothetical protein